MTDDALNGKTRRPRRPSIWKWPRRVGTTLTLATVLAWAVSLLWYIRYSCPWDSWAVGLANGVVFYVSNTHNSTVNFAPPGFDVTVSGGKLGLIPPIVSEENPFNVDTPNRWYVLPLWLPGIGLGMATVLLSLRRQRDFGLVLRPVRRKSRARRSLKWVCTGASVFFLLLWLGSLRWMAGYRGDIWELGYFDGRVCARAHYAGASEDLPRWHITIAPMEELGLLWPRFGGESGAGILLVPLWLPLVIFLLPSAQLWWLDRRRWVVSNNVCENCGYSLRGLPEPRCPECGRPFSIRPSAPPVAREPKATSETHGGHGKMEEWE